MAWKVAGQYVETCNCDFVCPCVTSALAKSTHGFCTFAMGFRIDSGDYNGTKLDGRAFVVVGHTPGHMAEGNWQVGLVIDEAADDAQAEAITAIASGQAGGPMSALGPMIGTFLGVERAPVTVDQDGSRYSVKAGSFVDESLDGTISMSGEQMYLDNTGHPANNRLALATASRSHVHAFGLDWDQEGGNNGHFAPFEWSG